MASKYGHIAWLWALAATAAADSARAENRFSIGGEVFRDHYEEFQGADVDTHTDYGSVTANYTHDYNNFFTAIDARYSWGNTDYKSPTGVFNGLPEFETDTRLREGIDIAMWHGMVMPYIGVGWRYYFQQGKGKTTMVGAQTFAFYDRHISQFYVPIGTTYRFNWAGFTFSPNAELDLMFSGKVTNHFAAVGLDQNVTNTQNFGWGLRGEFMAGQQYKYFGWEIGPFVRYWYVPQSDVVPTANTPPGFGYSEPKNARLQAGGALRVNF